MLWKRRSAPLDQTHSDMPAFPSQSLSAVGNLMETSALDETVRYAISTRHYLAYATPEGKGRVVAPHAYGITPEGEYTVVCWRFDTGRGPFWAWGREFCSLGRKARAANFRRNIPDTPDRL